MSPRIGIGFDAHPFTEGRVLKLGGVAIPHPHGLKGHSDGDALLHAVADAVLGAAGLGSLGEQFSDTDPAWQGADRAIPGSRRTPWQSGGGSRRFWASPPMPSAFAARAAMAWALPVAARASPQWQLFCWRQRARNCEL